MVQYFEEIKEKTCKSCCITKLNHFTNLQPLCSYYNRITKRAKIK